MKAPPPRPPPPYSGSARFLSKRLPVRLKGHICLRCDTWCQWSLSGAGRSSLGESRAAPFASCTPLGQCGQWASQSATWGFPVQLRLHVSNLAWHNTPWQVVTHSTGGPQHVSTFQIDGYFLYSFCCQVYKYNYPVNLEIFVGRLTGLSNLEFVMHSIRGWCYEASLKVSSS